jgi:hypothetical protein
MTRYDDYLTRKRREHGDRFDASALDPRFVPYFNNGQRIKVETLGEELTGTVGVTTGWRPCFLLMRTTRSMGSPYTLGPSDTILAVRHGRTYFPV